jgi:hypothetical protein
MNSSIEQLAASGNLDALSRAIAAGTDITVNDNAALRFASSGGHVAVMQLLIEAGATPDTRMLLAALRLGRNLSIRFLLHQGVAFDESWLIDAHIFQNITADTIAVLINAGLPLVEAHMYPNLSTINYAAYCAIQRGDIQTFLFTSALGADTNRIVKESLFKVFDCRDYSGISVQDAIRFADLAKACSGISAEELRLLDGEASSALFSDWIGGKFDLLSPAELAACEDRYRIIDD